MPESHLDHHLDDGGHQNDDQDNDAAFHCVDNIEMVCFDAIMQCILCKHYFHVLAFWVSAKRSELF